MAWLKLKGLTRSSKVFVLMDENTREHCWPRFADRMDAAGWFTPLLVQAGEEHKNIGSCLQIWNQLSQHGADRSSILINLGGGVITDLGGFVAATYKRGIAFVNIPTSLLAMVDASVGGKNGVDLGSLKNQIGTITLPEMVVIDIAFLETLPHRHHISGYAEMLKHGLIASREYWDKLKSLEFPDPEGLEDLIWQSIEIKNEIVVADPYESGMRKILNFGHTLGHAIESYFLEDHEKTLLHGEAIAIGLVLETYISHRLLGLSTVQLEDVSSVVKKLYPKTFFGKSDIHGVINLLIYDKKNRDGKVLFVLLEDFGKPKIDMTVDNELIKSAFDYYEKM